MIENLQFWAGQHQRDLEGKGIALKLSHPSEGLPKNGISAVFTSDRFEATVELWETGESEFYFLDWKAADRDPEYQVEITHHDFQNEGDLHSSLAVLLERLSAESEPRLIKITGFSQAEYFDPSAGRLPAAAKGRNK